MPSFYTINQKGSLQIIKKTTYDFSTCIRGENWWEIWVVEARRAFKTYVALNYKIFSPFTLVYSQVASHHLTVTRWILNHIFVYIYYHRKESLMHSNDRMTDLNSQNWRMHFKILHRMALSVHPGYSKEFKIIYKVLNNVAHLLNFVFFLMLKWDF